MLRLWRKNTHPGAKPKLSWTAGRISAVRGGKGIMAGISRREFVHSVAAAGASAAWLPHVAFAQSRQSVGGAHRIDVHHQILPAEYVAAVGRTAIGGPSPNRAVPNWDVAASLGAMDRNGVTSAIVSVSAPGVALGTSTKTARVVRACNAFAAQMVADYPSRFGMFATLPLPDVKSSLLEIPHAMDVLKADGVVLLTNYEDRYLGDPAFAGVLDELNARKAVVFVHPTVCSCNADVLPENPASMIEFPHDTTRAITSLLVSGAFARCPDVRFIFSHAGGTLPFLANRIARIVDTDRSLAARVPGGAMPAFRRLCFDTASSANPMAFEPLLRLVSPSNVLFGTDFPFTGEPVMTATIAGLRSLGLEQSAIGDIEGENAAKLFPRLRTAA